MKKVYAVLNLIVVVAVIIWNYFSNTGKINGKTIGEVSDKLDNLFTPAGYAFAIWGLIFIGLIANAIYQLKVAYGNDESKQKDVLTGPWLIIANVANGTWIYCWLNDYTGLSVLVMIVILLSLIRITFLLRLENHTPSREVIMLSWWPNTIYFGWISVALIANISAYLAKIGWADNVNEVNYTIVMVIVATIVNLAVLYTRNMREFCLVGIWSLIAIAMRSEISSIYYTALICTGLLAVLTMLHAMKNYKQNSLLW